MSICAPGTTPKAGNWEEHEMCALTEGILSAHPQCSLLISTGITSLLTRWGYEHPRMRLEFFVPKEQSFRIKKEIRVFATHCGF